MEEDLLKIINYYGPLKQLKYIHSEYFELDEAILDCEYNDEYFKAKECGYKDHIQEELADVMVMLKQLQYYYGIKNEDIEKVMQQKINRQLERIKNEQEQL